MVVVMIPCHGCNRPVKIDASMLRREGRYAYFCSRTCNAKFVAEQGAKQLEANYNEEELARRHRAMSEEGSV